MGGQVIVTAALTSRTGRKILAGALLFNIALIAMIILTLVAIPSALGRTTTSEADDASGGTPTVVGEWGYPLAGGYSKGRGYGHNPVVGCGYCSTYHLGYDMAQGCGSTIYAAGPGRVITAGAHYGWGNSVRIDHGGEVVTLYGHMQWGSIQVQLGQDVTAGTPLGREGQTGLSFGCHLHFEVQKSGTAVPPEPFMADLGLPLK